MRGSLIAIRVTVAEDTAIVVVVVIRIHVTIGVGISVQPINVAVEIGSENLKHFNSRYPYKNILNYIFTSI